MRVVLLVRLVVGRTTLLLKWHRSVSLCSWTTHTCQWLLRMGCYLLSTGAVAMHMAHCLGYYSAVALSRSLQVQLVSMVVGCSCLSLIIC